MATAIAVLGTTSTTSTGAGGGGHLRRRDRWLLLGDLRRRGVRVTGCCSGGTPTLALQRRPPLLAAVAPAALRRGYGAGSTVASIRFARPPWRRSTDLQREVTRAPRGPSSSASGYGRRCVTRGCGSATSSRAAAGLSTGGRAGGCGQGGAGGHGRRADRRARARPGPSSSELLHEVADASATLVEVVRLRLELTAALRDVEASRARLRAGRLRGAPPARARPPRRCAAAARVARHGPAARPAAPRRGRSTCTA